METTSEKPSNKKPAVECIDSEKSIQRDRSVEQMLERLLARWLVRAYLQKHGRAEGGDDAPEVA
ncbi:MAG: hypothetical protein E3J72_12130 [Planctomycetota bacterium]|nr:MAG: hypothetical protein E3J72_12130 [Planctomycetota bacterium]